MQNQRKMINDLKYEEILTQPQIVRSSNTNKYIKIVLPTIIFDTMDVLILCITSAKHLGKQSMQNRVYLP